MPGLGRVPSKPNTSQNRVNQRKTAEFRAKEYAVANKCAQRASTGFPARVSSANTSNGQARLLFFSLLLGTLGTACATARSASHQNVPSAIPHSQQQSHSRPVRSAGSGTAVTPVLPPESCSNPSILPVTISSTHPVDGGHPEGRHSSDDFGVLLDGLFLPASLKLNHLYSTLFPNTHTQLARVVDYSHETDAALGAEIASIFGTDGAQSCPDRNEKIAYLPQVETTYQCPLANMNIKLDAVKAQLPSLRANAKAYHDYLDASGQDTPQTSEAHLFSKLVTKTLQSTNNADLIKKMDPNAPIYVVTNMHAIPKLITVAVYLKNPEFYTVQDLFVNAGTKPLAPASRSVQDQFLAQRPEGGNRVAMPESVIEFALSRLACA